MRRRIATLLGLVGLSALAGCGLSLTVGGIVWAVTDKSSDEPNRPPSATLETPPAFVNDTVALHYTVVDPEGDAVRVRVTYSTDGGATFAPAPATAATGLPDHDGDTDLGTSPTGVAHTFRWNTAIDLLVGGQLENVTQVVARLQITQMDGVPGPTLDTQPFTVWNRYTATVAGGESVSFADAVVNPSGMVRDRAGNLIIADAAAHEVVRLDAVTGALTLIAGTGAEGFNGDNVPATQATLSNPSDVAIDSGGHIYIADTGNARIRRVDAVTGFITTVVGNGGWGYKLADENANPVNVSLTGPEGVDVDANDNLWVADTGAGRVRFVNRGVAAVVFDFWNGALQQRTIQPNTIRTIAGGWLNLGEDVDPAAALLSQPRRVRTININGNLEGVVIADSGLNRVRTVNLRGPADGIATSSFYGTTILNGTIRTVAGALLYLGPPGTVGDGGAATAGKLTSPTGIDVFWDFLLAVADTGNNRVRFVGSGVINTLAGTGGFGWTGDGGLPQLATLSAPRDCKLDDSLNIFVADTFNGRIRMTNTGFWAGVWTPSTTEAWLTGGSGLTNRTDGSTFTAYPVGAAELLFDVHGTGTSDIVTVGIKGNIWRWDGTQWNAEASGTTQPLLGVYALSSTAQWVVGGFGTVRYYNGSGWAAQSSGVPTTTLFDVWAANGSNVWAVGEQGTVRTFNGSSWGAESGIPVTTNDLNGIHGLGTASIYVVGAGGTFWHKTGSWTDRTSGNPSTNKLQAVWAASTSDVFAVGDGGVIIHYDGSTLTQMTSPTASDLQGVWGTSASDVYAVGVSDTVVHYNGSTWTQLGVDSAVSYAGVQVKANTINSITSAPPREVLAVVDPQSAAVDANGDIYFANSGTHRIMKIDAVTRAVQTVAGTGRAGFAGDGGAAAAASALTAADLRGVWGQSATDVWAAGTGGVLVHYNGSAWTASVGPGTADLNDLHGTSGSDIWAVGDGGVIWHWNGTAWTVMASGTTADLNGVFAIGTSDALAVGDAGTILHWNGTAWSAMASACTTDLYEVWASGSGAGWAVGAGTANPTQSSLWQLSGTSWTRVVPPFSTLIALRDVHGAAASAVLAVGDLGVTYRYNGVSWANDVSAVTGTLHACFGRTASDAYAGGDLGTFQARGASNWTTGGTVTGDDITESVGLRAGIAFGTAAYVVGDDGTIYQQAGAGQPWVLQHGLAQLSQPGGIALSASGQVCFIADAANNRVRALNLGTTAATLFSASATITIQPGSIATVAGGGAPTTWPNGDGGVATAADLAFPSGLAVDAQTGDLYIADAGHNRVRRVDGTTGTISAVAGTNVGAYTGDGGAATSATMRTPFGLAFDRINGTTWKLYIADTGNHAIRVVDSATLNINRYAGSAPPANGGFDSDGKDPLNTLFNSPWGLLKLGADLYVCDVGNARIRKIGGGPLVVTTVAGTGAAGYGGDPKPAANAQVNFATGLAYDPATDAIYFADTGNGRIRRFRR